MDWSEAKLNSEQFEFVSSALDEYELVGVKESHSWNCTLRYFHGGTNGPLGRAESNSYTFFADSPQNAKIIAEERIAHINKDS